jgi:hypothetical protein
LEFDHALNALAKTALLAMLEDHVGTPFYGIQHGLVQRFVSTRHSPQSLLETESRAQQYYLRLCEEKGDDLRDGYPLIKRAVPNILHLMERSYERQDFATVLDFLEVCSFQLFDMGFWKERREWSQRGYEAASRLAEHDSREMRRAGKFASVIGWFCCRGRQYDEAETWANEADRCFRLFFGVDRTEPRIAQLRGMIATGKGEYKNAQSNYVEALNGFKKGWEQASGRAKEDKLYWLTTASTNLGDLAKLEGDQSPDRQKYLEAEGWYRQVFDLARERCCDNSVTVDRYDTTGGPDGWHEPTGTWETFAGTSGSAARHKATTRGAFTFPKR